MARISGPLIDRIDIHIEVPPVPWKQLRADGPGAEGLSSEQMSRQVIQAREIQRRRFAHGPVEASQSPQATLPAVDAPLIGEETTPLPGSESFTPGSSAHIPQTETSTTTNASMSPRQVRQFCKLDSAGEMLLKQAMTELGLSARAHDKVLRVARTIADLEGVENIQSCHIAEAVQYRRLDRRM